MPPAYPQPLPRLFLAAALLLAAGWAAPQARPAVAAGLAAPGYEYVPVNPPASNASYDGNDTVTVGTVTIDTSAVFAGTFPANATAAVVLLGASWAVQGAGRILAPRAVGGSVNYTEVRSNVAGAVTFQQATVPLNANQDFDLFVAVANAENVTVKIVGYYIPANTATPQPSSTPASTATPQPTATPNATAAAAAGQLATLNAYVLTHAAAPLPTLTPAPATNTPTPNATATAAAQQLATLVSFQATHEAGEAATAGGPTPTPNATATAAAQQLATLIAFQATHEAGEGGGPSPTPSETPTPNETATAAAQQLATLVSFQATYEAGSGGGGPSPTPTDTPTSTPTPTVTQTPTPTATPPYWAAGSLTTGRAYLFERRFTAGQLWVGLAVVALGLFHLLTFAYRLARRQVGRP